MGIRSRRGRLAAVLAVLAVGLVFLLLATSGSNDSSGANAALGSLVAIVAAGCWVAAIIVISPLDRARDDPVAAIAAAIHGVAFLLPAASGAGQSAGEPVIGYAAFALGWVVVPLAWLANPAFLLAFALYRLHSLNLAAILCAVAAVMAVSAPLTLPTITVGPGFLLWAASPAVLVAAALWARRAAPRQAGLVSS